MKTLVLIVLMTIIIATLGQESLCPDEARARTVAESEVQKVMEQNDEKVEISVETELALKWLYQSLRPEAPSPARNPYESFLDFKCKATMYTLKTVYYENQYCHVIAPQWQNIQVAKCSFENCCNDDKKGICWPQYYKTYYIYIYCPKKGCRRIKKTYPTSCGCRTWKCLSSRDSK